MPVRRQMELQRAFPLLVVCSWLGNSPRIAHQSYLLVTEDNFAKAAGTKKVMEEGWTSAVNSDATAAAGRSNARSLGLVAIAGR